MSDSNLESPPSIIFDNLKSILHSGKYTNSVIIKTKSPTNLIIFSDNLEISKEKLAVKGLHVGILHGKAFSEEKETVLNNDLSRIDFVVQLTKDIMEEFNSGRFSATYPNLIRFLHTTCLYYNKDSEKIDHFKFVQGEILNKPIAVGNNLAIIGDRLVIEEDPIFYDCIVIKRDEMDMINVEFEPILYGSLNDLNYILLLGVENL